MPTLNVSSSLSHLSSAPAEAFDSSDPMQPLPLSSSSQGKSDGLVSLRFLLGLLALVFCIVGLSGCGGGWGEFKPTITVQVKDQTIKAGQTATFTVAATGTGPITYQWYKNGALMPGGTGLTFAMVAQASDTGAKIAAGATNAGGTAMSTGTLTVQIPPAITTQPASQTEKVGDTATFTVAATGTGPLTYQWFQNGVPIAAATLNSYTTPAATAAGTSTFAVTVSNVVGNVTSVPAVLTVNPQAQAPTLSFAPIPTHTFGDAAFPVTATSASSGVVTYAVVSGPATIAGNVVTVTGVGPVVLSANQAASGNYGAATASTNLTVNPAVPTLTFAAIAAHNVGDSAFPVTATSASSGAVTYAVVSGPATIAGNLVTLTGVGTVVLSASQTANGNYAAATAQANVAPGTRIATLAFAPIATQTYGGAPFTVSATSASAGAVTYAVTSGPATISGNTVTVTGVGTVMLSASQAAAGSYGPATALTSFVVVPAAPTLTFAPIATQPLGSTPFAVNATSASSGAVTYSVISGPATIAGNVVTLTGNGPVVLGASQAAAGNYGASTAQTTMQAAAVTPTLVFAPIAGHTYGDPSFPVSATSASPAPVTYAVASGPATVAGNTVTLSGIGTVTLTANQAATTGFAAAAPATATFNVVAETPTLAFAPIVAQTYGNPPFPVVATSVSAGAVTYSVVSGPATISGNSVTTTGDGAVTLLATQAASGTYGSATANAMFTVGTQNPTLTFASVGTHHFGDAPFTVTATSVSAGAVTYSVVSGPATISGNTVTVTGAGTVILAASQAALGGYTTANGTTTFAVGAETPTLVFAPTATQTYGGAGFTVSATSASTGAVTYAVVSGPATVSGSTVTTTGVGNVLLSASQAASGNYATAVASTSFSVVAAAPTLVFAPVGTHNFGDAPFTVSATSSAAAPVTYTVVSGPATVSGATVTITGNGTVVLSASQVASGNYAAATAQTNFTVGTATPTLAFAPIAAHTFGDPAFTVTATSASDGAVTYAVASGPATISGNTVTITGAGNVTLTANQAASGNYAAPAQATATLNVATEPPVLTFVPIPTQTFGGPPFRVSATSASSGAVTYSVVSGPATVVGNVVTVTGDGTITLGASQAASGNFSAANTTAFVTVGVATPALTFAPLGTHSFGDAPFAVSATSVSTGAVTYSVTSGNATIAGNMVTITGAGSVVLGASQAATTNYASATASTTVTVGDATPTLAFAPVGNHTFGDAPFTVSAASASTGAVTYAVQSGPATIAGNTVTITTSGTVVLTANQAAAGNYNAPAQATTNFTVGNATATLTFAPVANHTYGDAPFTVSATSASSGAVTYAVTSGNATISGNTVTITGTGTVNLSAIQAAAGNYAAATATTSIAVASATPTISFSVPNQTYGAAAFPVTATSNSAGALTYSVNSGPATISGNTVTLTGVGSVTLGVSQAASGNYTAGTGGATFTVAAATPSLSLSVANQTYGVAPFPVNATSNSPGAITYTVASGPATGSGNTLTISGAGSVTLNASQAATTNFNLTTTSATFTVAAAAPALSLSIPNQTYGAVAFAVDATSPSTGVITYTVTSGPATISGNMLTVTGSGSVTVGASQVAASNYTSATASATFTVAPTAPTLALTVANQTFGAAAFTVNATSPSTAAMTYTVSSGPATISGNTVTLTGAGSVTLGVSQAANGNYTSATSSATFQVAQETPTVSLTIANQTYGAAAFNVNATSNSTGAFTYTVVSGPATVSGNTVTPTGSGSVKIGVIEAATTNFTAGSASAMFTVAAGAPTIILSVPDQTYGAAPFQVNATSNSSGTITYAVVSGPATVSGNTVTLTGIGTVVLSASQAAAGSYTAGSTNTSFNVAAESPTITFSVPDQTIGSAPFTVSAGSNSSGSFTYSVVSGPATIAGSTVTVRGKGVITLKAVEAASGNFAAGSTTTSFNVDPAVKISSITPPNATIAPGTQVFTATATGGVTNAIIWSSNSGTFSGNTYTSPTAAGTYTITATSAENPNISSTTSITVSAPVITTQPTGGSECAGNGNLTVSVTAKYAATYHWFANGTAIPGATSSSYLISDATTATTNYTVQVSNPAGTVTSTVAVVTLGTVLTSNPKDVAVYVGQTATFSVSSTSGSQQVTALWYRIPTGSSTGVAISGANGESYTTGQLTASNNGDQYYAVLTDSCGNTITSSNATLSVNPMNQPPTITKQPIGTSTVVGGTAIFNVNATGAGTLSYQWFQIPAGQAAGVAVAGATSASYTAPSSATNASNNQDKYYVVVANAFGQAVSKNATLAVGTGILIQNQPQTVYTSAGGSASYSVTATSALPMTYQWYQANPGSSTFAAISGATGSTYTLPSAQISQSGSVFYVKVSNADSAAQSNTAALFVGPLASIPVCSTNWNTLGTAQAENDPCGYQLTAAQQLQHGDIVWPSLLSTDNIQLSFTVTTSNTSSVPADGYAVVFGDPSLGATLTSVGATGQGLGAEGIPGLVVAFDDYYNAGDPSVPYIGVGRGETALWENPYFYSNTTIPALAVAGQTISHTYNVTLVNGTMTVMMDNSQVFSGQVNVPPVAYLYVTSSTGSLVEQTVVTNISLTSAP